MDRITTVWTRGLRSSGPLLALLVGSISSCGGEEDPSDRVADYLLSEPYSKLVVEVDVVAGNTLDEEVATLLVDALEGLVDKPGGVEVVIDEILPGDMSDGAWSQARLDELGDETFNLDVDADTVRIHVLLLDGRPEGEDVLALSWANRHVALFKGALNSACSQGMGVSTGACRQAELGLLGHEIGHVLGLVDNGVDMVVDHEDPEHPHHTQDPDCLMYWAYDRMAVVTKVRDEVEAGTPAEEALGFCAPSLDDLAAFRAG